MIINCWIIGSWLLFINDMKTYFSLSPPYPSVHTIGVSFIILFAFYSLECCGAQNNFSINPCYSWVAQLINHLGLFIFTFQLWFIDTFCQVKAYFNLFLFRINMDTSLEPFECQKRDHSSYVWDLYTCVCYVYLLYILYFKNWWDIL